MASGICLTTPRLRLRTAVESDREMFLALFTDPAFMVFTADPCTEQSANRRFDRMLANSSVSDFAKLPIIEAPSDTIVGYIGVGPYEFEGDMRLEFGYRLSSHVRGRGYATEAGRALLDYARTVWSGTLMAMIDQTNDASMNVITKLGFSFWKRAEIDGRIDNLYQLEIPSQPETVR